MTKQDVKIERVFDASIQKVWEALTNNEQMKQWYFKLPEFKAEKGFEFRFYGGRKDGIQYLHVCQITEVIKEKKLAYSWRYEGYPGDTLVTFELFEEGNKTKLVLTHEGLETFDPANKDFAPGNFAEGWTSIVNVALKKYLEQ